MKYNYPKCEVSDLVEDHFGEKLACPYTWLRDTDNPKVKDFTARENAFTDNFFDSKELQDKIKEVKQNYIPTIPNNISPFKDGYIATMVEAGESSIVYLDDSFNVIKTLFKRYDLPQRTPLHVDVCPVNDDLLAINTQIDNDPMADFIIYDYVNKEIITTLPMTFSGQWSKVKPYFYSASTVKGITSLIRYNDNDKKIETIFTYPGNDGIYGAVNVASDNKSVIFTVKKDYSHNYYYLYNEQDNSIKLINEEALDINYVDSIDDKHYFISRINADYGKLISIDNTLDIDNASTVVKESDYILEHSFTYDNNIYLLESKDGSSYLYNVNSNSYIDTPVNPCSLYFAGVTNDSAIVGIDSFICYPQLLSVKDCTIKPLTKGQEIDDNIVVTLEKAKSKDGTLIPYYFIRCKDAKNDGSHPTIMFGYGGYNTYVPPRSNERGTQINIRQWVLDGGIHIHMLLRGGSEYGEQWHKAGMGFTKKNCYDDTIAIAEKLIADKWTCNKKLIISGCSNGGLLVTTLITMRPDLWGCVIASVPHTDMIHFAKDDRGAMYVTEYGDPYESKEMYDYFLSYSPIHNIKNIKYPPIYIQTGECDNNVPPYHGKSFAAAMQANSVNDNPVLLRVLALGAHDRGQGDVFWQTISEMQLFIAKAIGLD